MKVLQINSTLNWGSTGHIAEDISNLLLEVNDISYVAYGRYSNSSNSIKIKIGNFFDQIIHGLYTRLFDKHGLASYYVTKRFINQIKTISPDIIHLHNIHGYYLNYPLLFDFLSKSDIPVIWTFHDCWPFTGHCVHYTYKACYKWKEECYECPQKIEYPASYLLDRSRKNYVDKRNSFCSLSNLTIVTVSNWLSTQVQQSFFKKYPLKVIYNGVDTQIFKPNHRIRKTRKFQILGVANIWSKTKGLEDFVNLRSLLPETYEIYLIGLSKKQIKSLPNGINGIERTNNAQELVDYYSNADVYINASIQETLGLTSVESLSCGTPAIVYNSTACPETVSPETGFVVEPHDLQAVVKAIETIKKNGKEYYSAACRERAVKYFNKDDRYQEYIDLYKEILSKK